jgi:hypothetical protein
MELPLHLLLRRTYDAAELVRAYPPQRLTVRKQAVVDRVAPPDRPPAGSLEVTRWEAGDLPAVATAAATAIDVVPGWFEYPVDTPAGEDHWHLNFASSVAFATYAMALFAQDEMQVLEHPALMSVHEALKAGAALPRTVVGDRTPTPVLVRGVERRCAIDTAPDARAGRPRGLYGNEFERAHPDAIAQATRVLDPPSRSNILAIEAPAYGSGRYAREEIAFILRTAWAGFAAAGLASGERDPARSVIHTGFWGCGAYGGDRLLMTLLQCVAARLAGVDRLVFHAGSDVPVASEGVRLAAGLVAAGGEPLGVAALVADVERLGLMWGASDGN